MLFKDIKKHTFISLYGQHSFVLKKGIDHLELVVLGSNEVEIRFYRAEEWDDHETEDLEKIGKNDWTERNYIRNVLDKEVIRE